MDLFPLLLASIFLVDLTAAQCSCGCSRQVTYPTSTATYTLQPSLPAHPASFPLYQPSHLTSILPQYCQPLITPSYCPPLPPPSSKDCTSAKPTHAETPYGYPLSLPGHPPANLTALLPFHINPFSPGHPPMVVQTVYVDDQDDEDEEKKEKPEPRKFRRKCPTSRRPRRLVRRRVAIVDVEGPTDPSDDETEDPEESESCCEYADSYSDPEESGMCCELSDSDYCSDS